jgi:hypothetical protein
MTNQEILLLIDIVNEKLEQDLDNTTKTILKNILVKLNNLE